MATSNDHTTKTPQSVLGEFRGRPRGWALCVAGRAPLAADRGAPLTDSGIACSAHRSATGPPQRPPRWPSSVGLEASGVQILRNEIIDVAGLQIAGLDDAWAGRFDPHRAFATLDPSRPALALSHNPDTVDFFGWNAYKGWILSGHTHGGQCKPPFLPLPLVPVQNARYTAGEFALSGERRLYISRGVGHLLQVRFNVRPEVTVFELQAT